MATALPYSQDTRVHFSGMAHNGLIRLIILLLFTVSGGVLFRLFGYNYTGTEGSFFTKVHPSTYLSFIALGFFIISPHRHFQNFTHFLYFYRLPLSLVLADAIYAFFIIIADRRSIASTVDTYLYPVILVIILTQISDNLRKSLEWIIHVAFAANAIVALFELLSGNRLFPFVIDGADYEWDTRSTALMGHPLGNATMTGAYIITMLFGGASRLNVYVKTALILVQFAALGAFGGRTAFLLVLANIALFLGLRFLSFARGEKLPLNVIAMFLIFSPIVVGGFATLFMSGAFDKLLDRFNEDGGSANARLVMFELFNYITLRELVMGADLGLIKSLQASYGIEMGIENPIIRTLLTQGLVMTVLLTGGIAALFTFVVKYVGKQALFALLFYVILIMSYESISGKSIILAQFIALQLILYPSRALNSR